MASLPPGQYQMMLLGDKRTRMWITCGYCTALYS